MSKAAVVESAEGGVKNPIRCDKCHSPYAIDPAKRKNIAGGSQQKPKFRKRLDVETNKILILCNKCGLKMSRVKKRPPKLLPTGEEKDSYLNEARAFAESLAVTLQDPDAKLLFCPNVQSKPCGCIQSYVQGGEDLATAYERAFYITSLIKTSRDLSLERMHNASSSGVIGHATKRGGAKLSRGFGNRHSKLFEEFVLANRKYLREHLKFCEKASQRVLMYSNNFLHKELKSMKNQRVEKKTQKYTKMKAIADLASLKCCKEQCTQQAVTIPDSLECWRLSAQEGQKEARRVIAEMLKAPVGLKPNCYRFISMVTGCSLTKICSVNSHMRNTGGSAGPPEHGLKKWRRENPKGRRTEESVSEKELTASEDTLPAEKTIIHANAMANTPGISPPPYDSIVFSEESVIQMESPQEPIAVNVNMPQPPVQDYQEEIEAPVEQNPQNTLASSSPLLQSTVQQLLLSSDIVSVTILPDSKSPPGIGEITALENVAEGNIVLTPVIESSERVGSANICQVIQLCQQGPSFLMNTQQNLDGVKESSGAGRNCALEQSISELNTSAQSSAPKSPPDTVQRRQLLHVFEIPHCESAHHASGSAVCEDSSCLRNIIILPETIVVESSAPGSKNPSSHNEAYPQ